MTHREADNKRAEVFAVRVANLGQNNLTQSHWLVSARQRDVTDGLVIIFAKHFAHGGQRFVK